MPHYSALFRYQPRASRWPLEDFLTCSLVDILNRLPAHEIRAVVSSLFLNENARHAWPNTADLQWVAQYSLGEAGRCDILLRDGKGPLLIIENKINSAFTRSRSTAESADKRKTESSEKTHQLARYGQALHEICKKGPWRGALTLLTHYTSSPDDFLSSKQESYGVPFTNTCRWSQVHSWLKKLASDNSSSLESPVKFLVSELAQFLENEYMNAETITAEDVESAAKFIPSGAAGRVARSFSAIRQRLRPLLKTLPLAKKRKSLSGSGECYFEREGIVQDKVELHVKNSQETWRVEWGLCWPKSEWARLVKKENIEISNEVFWYVTLWCSEPEEFEKGKKLLQRAEKSSQSWRQYYLPSEQELGIFAISPTSQYSQSGNVDEVAAWISERIKEIREAVGERVKQRVAAKRRREG